MSKKCCCNTFRCCETCTEYDQNGTTRTRIVASIEFLNFSGSFVASVTEGGTNAVELPNTFTNSTSLNNIECSIGYMQCTHIDITCLKEYIKANIGSDTITNINDVGESNGYFCEANGGALVDYSNGSQALSIQTRVFTFTTDNGDRYLGVYTVKDDSDGYVSCQFQQAAIYKLTTNARATCDGVDQTLTLTALDDTYGYMTCNDSGCTQTITLSSVRVRLTLVP